LSPPRLSAGALAPASAAGVALARGMALAFLGEREAAAAAYAEVLALPPGTADALLPVQACRGMGELVEDESPQDALTWFARGLAGLAELADVSDGASSDASAIAAERGALLIKTGLAEIYLGRYAEAQAALEEGLALLPRTAPTLRATGLAQLGVIAMYTGDLDRAQAYTEQALALSRQTEDHFLAALILGNLGMIRHVAGDWAGGATRFREALAALAALGSEKQQGYMALNLGVAHLLLGEAEAAEQRLGESLALAQRYGDQLSSLKAWYHLAELRLREGNWEAAQELLAEAEATARAVEDNTMLVWIYAAQAEAAVAAGDCAAAEVPARQAVELGAVLEAASDQGIGLRALGKVLTAQGDTAGALAAFEASAACLADAEPYETARTQAVWGQALLAAGETATGQALLDQAQATFQQLGAAYDLAYMEEEHR
jgi:tetratricopeptide (TPR) repeat protein